MTRTSSEGVPWETSGKINLGKGENHHHRQEMSVVFLPPFLLVPEGVETSKKRG